MYMYEMCVRPGLGGSLMEGSKLPEVKSVDVGSVSQECLSHLTMPVGAGVVQRNQPTASEQNRPFGNVYVSLSIINIGMCIHVT